MLDPVPAIGIREGGQGLFIGGNQLADGGITDRMANQLEAEPVRFKAERLDLGFGQHLHAEIVGLVEIGLAHPGRAAAGRAIKEVFDEGSVASLFDHVCV